jgi:hypothetical protein
MVEKDIGVIRESNHTVGIFKALASLAERAEAGAPKGVPF